jgi:SSS family solute:Na+ symporter
MKGIRLPDYLVILAYFLIITWAGYRLAKTVRKAKDYFAAGNQMPWWLAGTSYYMASFSTMMFVIYSEVSYNYGIVGMTICWLAPPAFLLGAHFTAHRWRRARVLTPLGFIEKRFSPGVHQMFVWTGFPLRMVDNALRLYSTAIVMAVAVGGTRGAVLPVMAVIGIIMILYSFMGGQVTVVVTDFIQAAILVSAVILLFVVTLGQIGNLGRFFGRLPPGFLYPANHYGWSYLIFTTFLIWFLSYNASWSLVQKYNIVRSERDIRKMVRLIAILLFVSPPVFFFPGLAAKVLLPGLANPKEVYALVSMKLLPLGMMGLVIAALLSATMSTMGSEYNTLSGVLTRDFFRRRINPRIDEKEEIRLGRICTVLIGVVTILIGILLSYLRGLTLMDIAFRFMSAFAPPIMIPLIFGLLFRRFNSRGVIAGVIAGAVTGSLLVLSNLLLTQVYADAMKADPAVDFWLRSAWNSAATVANILATVAGMWFGSRKPAPAEERARADEFFSDLGKPFQSEEESGRGWYIALRIIPGALTTFGLILAGIAAFVRLSYADSRAFRTGLTVALAFVAAGAALRLLLNQAERPSSERSGQTNQKEKELT